MGQEEFFKRLISGKNENIIAKTARGGLEAASRLYEKGVAIRNKQFDNGHDVEHVAVPVISIGNITAGGTGKTPMVQFVCRLLQAAGRNPAVLSRGYKAKDNKHSIIVSIRGHIEEEPEVSGDEAWLLARSLKKSSVIIGRNRRGSAALAIDTLDSDVIVLDDGFQHRALGRDLDIVLIDATNPFGYEHVLPRGLLREPLENLKRAHLLVLTKVDQVSAESLQASRDKLRTLAPEVPVAETIHQPKWVCTLPEWRRGEEVSPVDTYATYPVLAVSGIGSPESFQKTLETAGYKVAGTMTFDDHHEFSAEDVVQIWKQAFAKGAGAIAITEKDAVKLSSSPEMLTFSMPVVVLGIGISFITGENVFSSMVLNAGKSDES